MGMFGTNVEKLAAKGKVEKLVDLIRSGSPDISAAAEKALVETDNSQFGPMLLPLLRDPNRGAEAARILQSRAAAGKPDVGELELGLIIDSRHSGCETPPEAAWELIKRGVRADALAKLGSRWRQELAGDGISGADASVAAEARRRAIASYAQRGERQFVVELLLSLLQSEDGEPADRVWMAETLYKLSEKVDQQDVAVEVILHHPGVSGFDSAARAVGCQRLKAALQDRPAVGTAWAYRELAGMGPEWEWALGGLVSLLEGPCEPEVLQGAHRALRVLSKDKRKLSSVAQRAQQALQAFYATEGAIPLLAGYFAQSIPEEDLLEAGRALAEFGTKAIEPVLVAMGNEGMLARYRETPMDDHTAGLLMVELTGLRLRQEEERLQAIRNSPGVQAILNRRAGS